MIEDKIQADLLAFVCRNFLVDENEIDQERSLIDQGIIDSFGLVEIATHIKKSYGIITTENEMNRDNFGSLTKMSAYISRKRNG